MNSQHDSRPDRPQSPNAEDSESPSLNRQAVEKAVAAVAAALDIPMTGQPVRLSDLPKSQTGESEYLVAFARRVGITLTETEFCSVGETFALVQQGYPIVFQSAQNEILVLLQPDGRRLEASIYSPDPRHESITQQGFRNLFQKVQDPIMLIAQRELVCDSLSAHATDHGDEHHHPEPFERFVALLNLDRRDIGLVMLFAGVAGILALATPLVIEGLVNVVSWGTYFQPLLVLAGMLLTCLGIAGVLKVLQTWVVEIIQRRQFVRIVSDLAHRFPRANQTSLQGQYPRELANRVFDIMTIQKATAILLLDGISIVLTTILGLVLLAFYHPFLLGFDVILMITMISLIWVLGRGGIRTAIDESKTKYAVAHWLQDIIAMPSIFKIGGGESLAIRRANQLTSEYVVARKRQFGVVIRQVIFAVSLQVLASTALLGLGGWLVIDGQLTLGQLVASELVVTVVVGAFAKAGKSLEKFYDMMAAIDKVGHLLDVSPDPRSEVGNPPDGPAELAWTDLSFGTPAGLSKVSACSVSAGQRVAITGEDQVAKSALARSLVGLASPIQGSVQVAGMDTFETAIACGGQVVSYAGPPQIFHGTLRENIDLGRPGLSVNRVREALAIAGLGGAVLSMPDGIKTRLQTDGAPLDDQQRIQLEIARAVVSHPSVLVVDSLLDRLGSRTRSEILHSLTSEERHWTLVVVTNRDDVADGCDSTISIHR